MLRFMPKKIRSYHLTITTINEKESLKINQAGIIAISYFAEF
jgi:hypothetical protein